MYVTDGKCKLFSVWWCFLNVFSSVSILALGLDIWSHIQGLICTFLCIYSCISFTVVYDIAGCLSIAHCQYSYHCKKKTCTRNIWNDFPRWLSDAVVNYCTSVSFNDVMSNVFSLNSRPFFCSEEKVLLWMNLCSLFVCAVLWKWVCVCWYEHRNTNSKAKLYFFLSAFQRMQINVRPLN